MILPRTFVPVALMSLAIASTAGCKDDPAPPTAEPASSASAGTQSKLPLRGPPTPMPKIDPQAMKEYRVDVCYFGTLSLKQARDAYFASLGKDEPSEKKIPSFGAPSAPAVAGTATPVTPPAGKTPAGAKPTSAAIPKPSPTTAPGVKPGATPAGKTAAAPTTAPKTAAGTDAAKPGAAAPTTAPKTPAGAEAGKTAAAGPSAKNPAAETKPEMRRPFDMAMRAPHERNARACTVAAGLKDFAMPQVDEALAAFAPYAIELSKNITAASAYYQREEYKKDSFEKGKEFHKKLVADFEKLDELSDKLGTSLAGWRKEHPADQATLDEGQKLSLAAADDAREILLGVVSKKIDVAAYKERVAKLEKSIEALKTFGTSNAADPWSKNLAPSLEAFLKTAKEAEPKVSEKGIQQDAFMNLITGFTSVIEARYRALSRSLIAKGQTMEPRIRPAAPPHAMPGMTAPAPAPAPAQEEAPH